MTLIRRDYLNPNKLVAISPSDATSLAIDNAAMGYDDNLRALMAKVDKQTKIIGALLETLSETKFQLAIGGTQPVLDDLAIRNILEDPYITSGIAQDY